MVSYSCRRRFAGSHQGVFDGEDGLFIVREGLRVQAFGKPLNVPDRLGVAKPSWPRFDWFDPAVLARAAPVQMAGSGPATTCEGPVPYPKGRDP
jgi:hypothetical protein